MKESELVDIVRYSLKMCFPGDCHFWKMHGNEFSAVGVPDIVGHVRGRFFGIELKVNTPLSETQLGQLMAISRTGGISLLVLYDVKTKGFYFTPGSVLQPGMTGRKREYWFPIKSTRIGGDTLLSLQDVFNAV